MTHDCICRACGKHFKGGPRAWYCPECREIRKAIADQQCKERRRMGNTRSIGSTDICERCGKEYTVEGGLQRFCPECGKINDKETRRKESLEYYHANKEKINPIRNPKRQKGLAKCVICGKEFDANHTRRNTCCEECKKELIRQIRQRADAKRSPRIRDDRTSGIAKSFS